MHLEDLTSLPLKVIYQRAMDMSLKYLSEMGEKVSSHSLGQFVIHKTEDAIWTFEKSVEWSAPSEPKKPAEPENPAEPKKPAELVKPAEPEAVPNKTQMNGSQDKEDRLPRPLPWLVFIPVLVVLTGTRIAYETAASMLGKAAVTPATVVHFLRNQRRSLRALRIRGKRTMKTRVSDPSTFSKMMSLVNPFKILSIVGLKKTKESKRDLEVSTHSELPEEDDDDKENVLEKLNRLSQEPDSIEDDPDFQPDTTASSDTSTSSGGDASEDDKEASTPATTDLDDVETPRAPRTSSFIGDVIQEEDEDESTSVKPADSISQVSENTDYSSLSATSPKVYPELCDSHDSAIKHISTIFNKSLTPQSSF